jgi:hypothetical protein
VSAILGQFSKGFIGDSALQRLEKNLQTGAVVREQFSQCPLSDLLSLVSCERIFRWWRSAFRLFRRRFLLRDWGVRCAAFPGRSAFWSTCASSRRSPLRRGATFGTCPALSSGTSLGRRAPFCSRAALYLRPLFSSRARGRCTFLTLRHMAPPVWRPHARGRMARLHIGPQP